MLHVYEDHLISIDNMIVCFLLTWFSFELSLSDYCCWWNLSFYRPSQVHEVKFRKREFQTLTPPPKKYFYACGKEILSITPCFNLIPFNIDRIMFWQEVNHFKKVHVVERFLAFLEKCTRFSRMIYPWVFDISFARKGYEGWSLSSICWILFTNFMPEKLGLGGYVQRFQ